MAAYANLTVGMSLDQYKQELVRVGFTDDLAQEFYTAPLKEWTLSRVSV
jgi:hypothetical protein